MMGTAPVCVRTQLLLSVCLSHCHCQKGMSGFREVTYSWQLGFWFTMSQQFVCLQVVFKTPAVKHGTCNIVNSVVRFQCHVHENPQ